jgi:hypothetical protein
VILRKFRNGIGNQTFIDELPEFHVLRSCQRMCWMRRQADRVPPQLLEDHPEANITSKLAGWVAIVDRDTLAGVE